MTRMPIKLFVIWALAATMAFAVEDNDPPGRAARLSFVEGTVSLQPGGVDDWVSAEVNRPLTSGDKLWTEPGSRAELQIGTAAVRLNGHTSASVLNLNDHTIQIEITLGMLRVHLRDLGEGETFEIDTPNLAFSLLRPGDYRIEVSEQHDATITVWGGQGEATTANGQAMKVSPRQQLRVSGQEETSVTTNDAQGPDSFDEWCKDRDTSQEQSLSAKYVSPEVAGSEDLDAAGIWRSVQEFGQMWVPSGVSADWAPYSSGHWVWVEPWGWTWVDSAPWGYAPYHYGRWAYVRGTWGWVPGPRGVYAVYSPALVAWRGGVVVSVGGPPAVGWVPLGPGEVWVPGYHASKVYFERVNRSNTIVNNVHITNVYNNTYIHHDYTHVTYANERVKGAMTAMPHSAMMSGSQVSKTGFHPSSGALSSGQWRHTAPVPPQREAVLGGRPIANGTPPASATTRTVVAKASPPPPPVPFSQKQSALQASGGRPLDTHTISQLQRNAPPSTTSYRVTTPANVASQTSNQPGRTTAGNTVNGRSGSGAPSQRPPTTTSRGSQSQTSNSVQAHAAAPQQHSTPQQHPAPQSHPVSTPRPAPVTHSSPPRVATSPPPKVVIHH
jgi:hypothetical protein